MAETLKKSKGIIFGGNGGCALCLWGWRELNLCHQVSAARNCFPAWEQIVSQPGTGLDTRSHTNTKNTLVWSSKALSFFTFCFPKDPP